MNDVINKFLLAGDKFMPEMHLRQPRFTIVLANHLLRIKKESKNKKNRNSRYIYKSELDKTCFQHDMVYGGFKDLTKRTAADKVF